MAEAKIEVEVSFEAALHRVLASALQDIERKHGVRINELRAQWLDVSNVDRQSFQLTGLTLETSTGEPSGFRL